MMWAISLPGRALGFRAFFGEKESRQNPFIERAYIWKYDACLYMNRLYEIVEQCVFYIASRFLATWKEEIEAMNRNKLGRQYLYHQSMIEFLSVLYSKGFGYGALQGVVGSCSEQRKYIGWYRELPELHPIST